MVQRTPLIQQLKSAWKKTIDDAYNNRLINSERGLQAYFCASLLEAFRVADKQDHRRLFIEPHLPGIKGIDGGCYPDVVICNSRQIIGVVELKYKPRAEPGTDKDLQSLEAIARGSGKIELANDRYHGPTKSNSYSLAEDAVFCWAGVSKNKPDFEIPTLGASMIFLRLDALARKDDVPILLVDGTEAPLETDSGGEC